MSQLQLSLSAAGWLVMITSPTTCVCLSVCAQQSEGAGRMHVSSTCASLIMSHMKPEQIIPDQMDPSTENAQLYFPLSFTPSAAPCRFIPRHADELELDVDDPLYVEEEEDDYWYRGYNMRTGERGIFPAFYAHEVMGQSKELLGE